MIKTTLIICMELVIIVSLLSAGCIETDTPQGNATEPTPNATEPTPTPTPEATPTPTPEATPTPTPTNNTTTNESAADLCRSGFYGSGSSGGSNRPIAETVVPEIATILMVGCGLSLLAVMTVRTRKGRDNRGSIQTVAMRPRIKR